MSVRGLSETADLNINTVLDTLHRALPRYRSDPVLTSTFAAIWAPKAFALLPIPFSEEDGTMSSRLKVVRRKIVEQHRQRIQRLYAEEEDPLNAENREVPRQLLATTPR
jgi:long-chain acyl-CoA synthetase